MNEPSQAGKEALKIEAIVKFNDGKAYVLNRGPNYTYKKDGNIIYAVDGPFIQCFFYETPSESWKAFAGRKFELPMEDGTTTKCYGQWWHGGTYKVAKIIGKNIIDFTYGTISNLKKCYVFCGQFVIEEELKKLEDSYDGFFYPYRDYEKVIKYDEAVSSSNAKIYKLETKLRELRKGGGE